jgi:hypothetical protein
MANRREIADLLVLVAAAAPVTPTESPIRNGRREATPARTGSSTSRLSGSSAANSR